MKKLAFVMLALCITTGGASAEATWTDGTGDGLWSTAGNWTVATVPSYSDSVFIKYDNTGAVGPTFDATMVTAVFRLSLEVGTGTSLTMTMTGGELYLRDYLRLGAGGSTGTAVLNMSGGTLTILEGAGLLRIGSGYTGQLSLSGTAQITALSVSISSDTGSYVDLSDSASIVLKGDKRNTINTMLLNSVLTSNGGTVTNVAFVYDSGTDETTITATTQPQPDIQVPYNLSASFQGTNTVFGLSASDFWSPAGYAFTSSQWQISSTTDFSAPAWDSGIIGPVTTVFVGSLPAGDYYGRVRYLGDTTWSDWSETEALDLANPTIAYWRFEDGVNGQEHPADHDNWYQDISGNGNNMTTYDPNMRPTATNSVPFDIGAGIGVNELSLHFEEVDDLGSYGIDFSGMPVNDISFTNGWTIECSFNMRLFGNRVPFGKNGYMVLGVNEQPFAFKILGGEVDGLARLECIYWDDNRDRHSSRTGYIIDTNVWYSAVATHDTETFSFYLKSEDDSGFSLIQSLGAVPAALDLESVGSSLLETNNSWVVGRGLRQGVLNYYFRGDIDEIRISDRALAPSEFIAAGIGIPVDLIVESDHGIPIPPVGTNAYWSTNVICSVNASVVDGGTNYLCTGWAGTGSVPSSGTSNATGQITLIQDSSITWNWATEYWMDVAVTGSGTVNVAEGWYSEGTNLSVVATAGSNWLFTGWSGNLSGDYTTAITNLVMNGEKSITATFSDDADDDGLTNAEEDALETDPRDGDTDSDGMPDGWEVNMQLDPLVDDAGDDPDSDTLSNLEEYGYGTHPKKPDTDSDGLDDNVEINTHGTDPVDSDSDDDGMPDGYEIAQSFDPNVDDASDDADSDGLSNLEEYQHGTDPHDSDSDDDGMEDGWEVDNALNPKLDDAMNDPDTDYLNNLQEYQAGTDPQDNDSDDDWLIDGIEILMGLNPTNPDSDSDGMPDGWEQSYGLLPLVDDSTADKDGDGHSNLQEFITGMSPNDPGSIFSAFSAKAEVSNQTCMVVAWPSFTNRTYTVQWADNLTNSFQPLEPTVDYPQNSYTDTLHGVEREGFYKVDVQLKP